MAPRPWKRIEPVNIDELLDVAKGDGLTDPAAILMAYDQLMELKKGKS